MYNSVEFQENSGLSCLVFFEGKDEEGALVGESHLIPLAAIADRMELLGLESVEQALEYLGREFHNPEISDGIHGPVQEAYREVAQSEFSQTLMPSPTVQESGRQTLMSPMRIAPSKRDALRDKRGESLQLLGMLSMIHSEPAVRMMDARRPVERTVPAAAEALGASSEAISDAVALTQDHNDLIEAWRVETLTSYVPQLRFELEKQTEERT